MQIGIIKPDIVLSKHKQEQNRACGMGANLCYTSWVVSSVDLLFDAV